MDWVFLADLVFWLHMLVIVALFTSMFLYFKVKDPRISKWVQRIYFPLCFSLVPCQILFCGCPLVDLENSLRSRADPSYAPMDSFVTSVCEELFSVYIAPEIVDSVILVLWFIGLYAMVVWVQKRYKET